MDERRTVDVALLRKAVEWVEEQDKLFAIDREWDQECYQANPPERARNLAEKIAFENKCLRGMSVLLYSKKIAPQIEPHCGTSYCVAGYIGQMLDDRYKSGEIVDDVHVADFAAEKLGISPSQAYDLFNGDNSAADVRRIAEEIAGEKL